ncbi:MAG: carboxylate--amine ligase [Firmicutes bacterium]|nr:carboxylate--amine ligase [Bacillota bacterium]
MIYQIKKRLRSVANKSKHINRIYKSSNRLKVILCSLMSDEVYSKLKYHEDTGLKLNLDNPITFNEKIWWLKLNNRDPLLTTCSDKVEVRKYIIEKGLEDILIPIYGVFEDANDIDFEKLKTKYFIKTNHGSGTNAIWDPQNPFNRSLFTKKFNRALRENYYLQSREWNYKNIKPKIVIEEVLEDNNGIGLVDYKFMCFEGKVKLVFSEIGIASNTGEHNPYSKRNVHDANFDLLDMEFGRENFDSNLIEKPSNFEAMIKYAEILAEPFPHCRVDLYNINGKVYFGEMTFYHGGGTQRCKPELWEKVIGDWINLKSDRIILKEQSLDVKK